MQYKTKINIFFFNLGLQLVHVVHSHVKTFLKCIFPLLLTNPPDFTDPLKFMHQSAIIDNKEMKCAEQQNSLILKFPLVVWPLDGTRESY